MNPETKAISRLSSSQFEIDGTDAEALKNYFEMLRRIDDEVSRVAPEKLHESKWTILGVISRSYQLMICSINQVSDGNWNGYYTSTRGLIETLCSLVWLNDNPARLPNLVQMESANIGSMLNAGYEKYPDIEESYKYLSGIVHPGRNSHLLGFRDSEDYPEKGMMSPFNMTFSQYWAEEKISLLRNVGNKIEAELEIIASYDDEMYQKGRVMMRASPPNDET